MKRIAKIILTTTFPIFITSCGTSVSHDLVITNVNIINVQTGEILSNRTVGIDSNRISNIYSEEVTVSEGSKNVDGENGYLIPGLWDMHVHHNWNYQDTNPLLIANGITGVREMWGNMQVHRELQKAIKEDTLDVPDIYTGSVIIDGEPKWWPGSIGVKTPKEAYDAALQQIETGVDFLKVYSLLTEAAFDTIAFLANQKGIPFAGHVPDFTTVQHAAEMGMASMEHVYGLLLSVSTKRDSLLKAGAVEYKNIDLVINTFSQERFDSLCILMKEKELWMSPTMVVRRGYAYKYDPDFIQDERIGYMADYMIADWFSDEVDMESDEMKEKIARGQREYNFIFPLVGEMQQKGVRFIAGSDYPNPLTFPGFSLHDELELYVEAGMDKLAALQTATINPAIFMNKEVEFGTVEVGKKASLVLLERNPLENITNTRAINAVVLRGKAFDKKQLEDMLLEVKSKVEKPSFADIFRELADQISFDEALDSLTILINENSKAYTLEANEMGLVMQDFYESGEQKKMVKYAEYLIKWFPEFSTIHTWSGEVMMMVERTEDAVRLFNKALELDPDNSRAAGNLEELQ